MKQVQLNNDLLFINFSSRTCSEPRWTELVPRSTDSYAMQAGNIERGDDLEILRLQRKCPLLTSEGVTNLVPPRNRCVTCLVPVVYGFTNSVSKVTGGSRFHGPLESILFKYCLIITNK